MRNTDRVIATLRRDRPMVTVTLRMPEDVVEDLKSVAPRLGFSGYQPLMRAYVGRGLRADIARLDGGPVEAFMTSLRRRGVDEELLREALEEAAPDPR